ncbi:cytochrome oxidase small assembly protein [Ottowia sp. SB7-C50]|nr:cytochrome oxidase small assembly protein [Ottowia sp. SB7-C50]WOP17034.1 cytochrome oxidase small assembly protein [Ottowia sp. SB7-C50]
MSDEQRRRNVRLGLILGTVALVFFIGFIVRMVVLGR